MTCISTFIFTCVLHKYPYFYILVHYFEHLLTQLLSVLPVCVRTLRETQPWTSPQVSDRYLSAHPYPTVGQISPRTRKSMSLDMGQPSQANTKKLLGMYDFRTPSIQDMLLCCWSLTGNYKKKKDCALSSIND